MKNRQRLGWVFISPSIFSMLVFTLIPLLCAVYFAFVKYDLFTAPRWVGFDNFRYWFFEDIKMWEALRNTFTYAFITVPLELVSACLIASLLNTRIRTIGVFRSVYYLPVLTPGLAITLIWLLMYNPADGLLNTILSCLGMGPFKFVFSTNWLEALTSISVMAVWKRVGYTSIYLFTAMQAINEDVMEAAEIDGAVGIVRFFRITLPLITPTLFFLLIIGFSTTMQEFDVFYLMEAYSSSRLQVLNTLMYRTAWGAYDMGRAAAISWISFFIILAFTVAQKVLEKRWVYYE